MLPILESLLRHTYVHACILVHVYHVDDSAHTILCRHRYMHAYMYIYICIHMHSMLKLVHGELHSKLLL